MNPTLTIEYDPATNTFSHRMSGEMPSLPLVGQLEFVKALIVDTQKQALAAQQEAAGLVRDARIAERKA